MMHYLEVGAGFIAFFVAFLLYRKKPYAFHDKVLTQWLCYLGLYVTIYALWAPCFFYQYPLITNSFIYLLTLHGPFLYFYVKALVSNKKVITPKDFIHFIPLAAFNLCLLLTYFFYSDTDLISLNHVAQRTVPSAFILLSLLLITLSGAVYIILTLRLLNKHNIHIFNNFSFAETIDLNWLRRLITFFGLSWIVMIIVITIHHIFHLFSMTFCTDGIFGLLSLFIIFLGYYGLKQKEIYTPETRTEYGEIAQDTESSRTKYRNSTLQETDSIRYAEILVAYMKTNKPYLDPELTLKQLSDAVNINSHYLSQLINETFNNNFFNFINQYRVEEFKAKLNDSQYTNFSILGIALECGFNSKASFNRIFKNTTGLTPSEYKKQIDSNVPKNKA